MRSSKAPPRASETDVRVDAQGCAWLPGVGEPLPAGERVRWVGRPDAASLARRVLHVRGLTVYFVLLTAATLLVRWRMVGAPLAALDALTVLGMGAAVLAFARVYAAVVARSTLYAVTDRRVVIRAGIAIPAVLNIPLDRITSVDVRRARDGAGDVEVTLGDHARIAYLLLWPHARPWYLNHPRPTFRGVRDVEAAALALANAVRAIQPAGPLPSLAPSAVGAYAPPPAAERRGGRPDGEAVRSVA